MLKISAQSEQLLAFVVKGLLVVGEDLFNTASKYLERGLASWADIRWPKNLKEYTVKAHFSRLNDQAELTQPFKTIQG